MKAWLHDGGKLEPVILSHTQEKVHPSLVMVVYNNQYYLQPVEQTTLNAAASNEEDRGRGLQERISIVRVFLERRQLFFFFFTVIVWDGIKAPSVYILLIITYFYLLCRSILDTTLWPSSWELIPDLVKA